MVGHLFYWNSTLMMQWKPFSMKNIHSLVLLSYPVCASVCKWNPCLVVFLNCNKPSRTQYLEKTLSHSSEFIKRQAKKIGADELQSVCLLGGRGGAGYYPQLVLQSSQRQAFLSNITQRSRYVNNLTLVILQNPFSMKRKIFSQGRTTVPIALSPVLLWGWWGQGHLFYSHSTLMIQWKPFSVKNELSQPVLLCYHHVYICV